MKYKTFYLAHPLDSRCIMRKWEIKTEAAYGVTIINPFYDVRRADISKMDSGRAERYSQNQKQAVALVKFDVDRIKKAGAVIAVLADRKLIASTWYEKLIGKFFNKRLISIGTIMEMVYAKINKIPCFVVCPDYLSKHPWVKVHSTKIFTSLDELCEILFNK